MLNIKVRDRTIYTSTSLGHFKRHHDSNLEHGYIPEKKCGLNNLDYFKCPTCIIDFEIITSSRVNQSIKVKEHQHLAALACSDGFLYIISREMNCEQKLRMSHEGSFQAIVRKSSEREYGYKCLFLGKEGTLVTDKGRVITSDEKGLYTLVSTEDGVICGSRNNVVILTEPIQLH